MNNMLERLEDDNVGLLHLYKIVSLRNRTPVQSVLYKN